MPSCASNTQHTQDIISRMSYSKPYRNRAGHLYTGSGVILVETQYTKGRKPTEMAVILFMNRRRRVFEDLGGLIDAADHKYKFPIAGAARREVTEESEGYLSFQSTKTLGGRVIGQDIFVDHYDYRGYFVGIPSGKFIRRTAKSFLDANPSGEMMDVTRVYVSDLLAYGLLTKQGNLDVLDTHGTKIVINGRTKALLRKAYNAGIINLVATNPKTVTKAGWFTSAIQIQ